MNTRREARNGDKSFSRLFAIIQQIAASPDGMPGREIAQAAGVPASTTFRMLKFMVENGFVLNRGNCYILGAGFIRLGIRAREQNPLHLVAHPYLEKLAEQTMETVHLAVLRGVEVYYFDKVEGRRSVRMGSLIGNCAPAYCTGVGKAILAFMPEKQRGEILAAVRTEPFTETTLVTREALENELRKIVQCGYALDDCEHERGVFCVAAPIVDSSGRPVAGISVSGSELYLRDQVGRLSRLVVAAAHAISDDYNGKGASI